MSALTRAKEFFKNLHAVLDLDGVRLGPPERKTMRGASIEHLLWVPGQSSEFNEAIARNHPAWGGDYNNILIDSTPGGHPGGYSLLYTMDGGA